MAKASQRDWLLTGFRILEEQGATALTIERLTTLMGLTKGSFYHHFHGFGEYKSALLELFEKENTLVVIRVVNGVTGSLAKLSRLFDLVCAAPPHLEIAMRAWALQDDDVRAVQARVDEQRIAYVAELCLPLVEDETRALTIARGAYAILIGGYQLQPPYPPSLIRSLLGEYIQLQGIKE